MSEFFWRFSNTFSNRWLNFFITGVTFFKHFVWLLFIRFYFHQCIFSFKTFRANSNIQSKMNSIKLVLFSCLHAQRNSVLHFLERFFCNSEVDFFNNPRRLHEFFFVSTETRSLGLSRTIKLASLCWWYHARKRGKSR